MLWSQEPRSYGLYLRQHSVHQQPEHADNLYSMCLQIKAETHIVGGCGHRRGLSSDLYTGKAVRPRQPEHAFVLQ